ncbi:LysR substrate-binding domain-containing protein [Cobetia amphilecti]|uniref:LysR substrate-binding domain-containing protein n=1 Tax=Cobetia amphilecti TaxID=1055104 RepID=A0AAP4WWR6_9GAMM|nr:LysR substrate-binding domain-containing protein [Cobetia amphilecti]MDO6671467.1 LysR substrate-binding domain-containing protein [Cobetia amphilecti]
MASAPAADAATGSVKLEFCMSRPAYHPSQRLAQRLPPFNALTAFEATARLGSLTRAAAELCITQGAVSQRVKQLEDFLAVSLFVRRGNRIELTDEAHAYLPLVSGVFETLKRGTATLFQHDEQQSLTLRSNHSFVEYWLIPRLKDFQRLHPNIQVTVLPHNQVLPDDQPDVDIEIINGYGGWCGREYEKLADEQWVVVASPTFLHHSLAPNASPASPLDELARAPRIECIGYRESWLDWFRLQKFRGHIPPAGLKFGNASLAIAAALEGHGFLLVRQSFVMDLIKNGRLQLAHTLRMPSTSSQYLLVSPERRHTPAVNDFCAWLRSTMHTSQANPVTSEMPSQPR